jgi:hypothetical protein
MQVPSAARARRGGKDAAEKPHHLRETLQIVQIPQ